MVSGGDRMTLVQAAVAATISRDLGMPLAQSAPAEGIAEQQCLVLVGDVLGVGEQVGDRLSALERLMRWTEEAVSGVPSQPPNEEAAGGQSAGMTEGDITLDGETARLHNQILNPALPFRAVTPSLSTLRTIDATVGEALRSAQVAGALEALPPDAQAQWDLLFADGEPTPTLQAYQEHEEKVEAAAAEYEALPADAPATERRRLGDKVDRLRTMWLGLGKKREVEEAFRAIQAVQEDSGHHDERARALERWESGVRYRSDLPGQTYHLSHLSSIAALFTDPGEDPRWRGIVLDRTAVLELLGTEVREVLGLEASLLEEMSADLAEVRFEYLVADITRDWLDLRFLRARYWRTAPGEPALSDGHGGGDLPCLPTRIVLLRAVEYDIVGYAALVPRAAGTGGTAPVMPPKRFVMLTELTPSLVTASLRTAQDSGMTSAATMLSKEFAARSVPSVKTLELARFTMMPEKVTPVLATLSPTVPQEAVPQESIRAIAAREPLRMQALAIHPILPVSLMLHTSKAQDAQPVEPKNRKATVRAKDVQHSAVRSSVRSHKLLRGQRLQNLVHIDASMLMTPLVTLAATVRVAGTLTISEQDGPLPALVISHRVEPEGTSDVAVELVARSPHRAGFSLALPARTGAAARSPGTCIISLRLATGELLAESSIAVTDKAADHTVAWTIVPAPVGFVITEHLPVIHAYVVQGQPPMPDPDPDLHWT